MCSLNIYAASQYLIETLTVRCVFSLKRDIGKQTITFSATPKRQTRARKADESVVRIEENSFNILDKLTVLERIETRKNN